MKPITFPQRTCVWAENQPEYLPLPAFTNERETISLWQMTWRERAKVLWTGKIWSRQGNLGRPLQAQLLTVDDPFSYDYSRILPSPPWPRE